MEMGLRYEGTRKRDDEAGKEAKSRIGREDGDSSVKVCDGR